MDGWKDRTKSGRKESGFENLKTRFQDGNLSRKQESKFSGWHENRLAAKRESNQSAKKASSLCGKIESKAASRNESKQENDVEILPACHTERKQIIHLYGWQSIMMYHNKEVLQ